MGNYEKGLSILAEKFGNNKDNVISLATISLDPAAGGKPCPVVRDVDAYYEGDAFYVVTYGESNKMKQIAQNDSVAIAVCFEWFTASGIGENLGWVLEPKNAALRDKLRTTFAAWYDMANNENDKNCCILAIKMANGIINLNHHETLIHMDFINKEASVSGKPLE